MKWLCEVTQVFFTEKIGNFKQISITIEINVMSDSERSASSTKDLQLKTGKKSIDIKSKIRKASNKINKNQFFVELNFWLVSMIIIAGVFLLIL